MCRILAFNVDRFERKYAQALAKAAEDDPYFVLRAHDDGWGISAYVLVDGEWRLVFYKTRTPIFRDQLFDAVLSLLDGRRAVGIIHARKGRRFLYSVRHNHPYHARSRLYDLFFAHNGSISRKAFAEPNAPFTDSYLFFAEVVARVNGGLEPFEAYKEVVERLKPFASSLNSALLTFNDVEGPKLYFVNFRNPSRAREVEEYYRMYHSEGYVFSSTVKLYLNSGDPVPEGEVLELEYKQV